MTLEDYLTVATIATIALTYFAVTGWIKYYKAQKAFENYIEKSSRF